MHVTGGGGDENGEDTTCGTLVIGCRRGSSKGKHLAPLEDGTSPPGGWAGAVVPRPAHPFFVLLRLQGGPHSAGEIVSPGRLG